MGRISDRSSPDRFLSVTIAGNYQYKRRVPAECVLIDKRAPTVRMSLKTSDLAIARRKRDLLEEADDALWASMIAEGKGSDAAQRRYEAATKRVEALGFSFRSGGELELVENYDDLRRRLMALEEAIAKPEEIVGPIVGAVDVPKTPISKAFRIYVDEIVADELIRKSKKQRAQWEKVKLRAVNNFIRLTGSDKPMVDITLEDAKKIYLHWLGRIAPKTGKATAGSSSGNRDIGNLRVLHRDYFKYMGEPHRSNPFDGFGFSLKKKRSRPPFPTEWIRDRIMAPGALAGLNEEARGIVLIIIETGARPSEIANLQPATIRLSGKVPHLAIEPRDDPDDPREIKTESSQRLVPLVGVALAAAQRHKKGFPRYREREDDLSATLNKFFKENDLFPTPGHKIYSLRHSFEDRMKEGGLEDELRRILMGHTVDRPRYGSGGSLEWRRKQMLQIVLPFKPEIV